jgi:hypothetical protein
MPFLGIPILINLMKRVNKWKLELEKEESAEVDLENIELPLGFNNDSEEDEY